MRRDPNRNPLLRGCNLTRRPFRIPADDAAHRQGDAFVPWDGAQAASLHDQLAGQPLGADNGATGSDSEAMSPGAIAAARAEAARIIEQAKAEGERLAQEAARAVAEAEKEAFSRAASQLLDLMQESCARQLERLEGEIAALVADIASEVLGRMVAADDTIVVDVVRKTLEQVNTGRVIRVAVHPEAEPAVRAAQEQLATVLRSREPFEIVADDSVDRGGVLVEMDTGMLDARIGTQLETVRREVEAELNADDSAAAA